jgi:hypothetical protein
MLGLVTAAGQPMNLTAPASLVFELVVYSPWLIRTAGSSLPGAEGENTDTSPLPPGTERAENLLEVVGIGILVILLLSAVLIMIRARR